jgi:signal transduction histidine kinase
MLEVEREVALFGIFWEIFPDDLFGFSMRESLASNQAPARTSITLNANQDNFRELEINVTFVLDKKNGPENQKNEDFDFNKGVIILIQNMTEVRYLQRIANRNDRMKDLGEMAAMVAHEIRNPLGGIRGFASLLVRDLEQQPEMQQMAKYIVEGTDNLNRLVTDVLNYSRPIQLKFEKIDFISLVEEVKQHVLMDSSFSQNIGILFLPQLKTLIVPMDAHFVKSALLNLIVNAIQAMPNGGDITINLKQKKNMAILEVIDTGIGILTENLEKIYTPFFTTKPQGHGFGLPEVYKIIKAHQGTIEVESTVGQGTTFIVKLPLT